MRRLHLLVEGQTEEIIARDVLAPHFASSDVWVTFSIYKTKRPASGPSSKGGPELVDDGVRTAPSKRILNAYPRFSKTIDGPLVIVDAGLDAIRQSCPHADKWLAEVETRLKS